VVGSYVVVELRTHGNVATSALGDVGLVSMASFIVMPSLHKVTADKGVVSASQCCHIDEIWHCWV
jgi:uncharacterized protein YwlG (UPF0340 family)